MKQPVKSDLLKYYYAIAALALHPLFVSHNMRDMPIGRKTLNVSVRFVLHEALGPFLTNSLEFSFSTMLSFKCAVDFFSNGNSSKIHRCVRVSCPPKALAEILPFKLLQYRRQRNIFRDSISSLIFHSFFFCS